MQFSEAVKDGGMSKEEYMRRLCKTKGYTKGGNHREKLVKVP